MRSDRPVITALLLFGSLLCSLPAGSAADWPMWRYGPARGAATPHGLPERLHLHWVLELPEPRRAWPEQFDDLAKLQFDLSYEPVVAGETLYVPSMVTDSLTAYDIVSGAEKWRYYTDGPVRLAPVVGHGRVYVPSDDGAIHCLDAASGEVLWKFQGGPVDRTVLGNERLIGTWPVRGGPVLKEGTLYFAAGIWPLEGVFVYALDAQSGEIRWTNSGTSNRMEKHPHSGAYAFGGVAPQGCLAVSGDRLIVPGGRTTPAVFDRTSGDLLYFHHYNRNAPGGHRVYASADFLFNPKGAPHARPEDVTRADGMPLRDPGKVRAILNAPSMYRLQDGRPIRRLDVDVVSGDVFFGVDGQRPVGYGKDGKILDGWRADAVPDLQRLHLLAGRRLYGSGKGGRIFAMEVAASPSLGAELKWSERVEGEIFNMLAARQRLFVVTTGGRVYCFGPQRREPVVHEYRPEELRTAGDEWTARSAELLRETDAKEGYAIMFGVGAGRLLEELLIQSDLHFVAFDPDETKVRGLRERFTRAGVYGRRVAVHQGDAMTSHYPPYIASLIVSEDPRAAGLESGAAFVQVLFSMLRPYGGAACLLLPTAEQAAFAEAVREAELEDEHLLVRREDDVLLRRPGALRGAGAWTHQYADSANTSYSGEQRVRAPLGITWFGGSTNCKTLHKYDCSNMGPRVVAGRLLLLGENHLLARCVFTGRELWQVELPMVGRPAMFRGRLARSSPQPGGPTGTGYTFRTEAEDVRVIPGLVSSDETGVRPFPQGYVGTPDSVYVVHDDSCLRLDLDTGNVLARFDLPGRDSLPEAAAECMIERLKALYLADGSDGGGKRWGQITVWEDLLIAGAYPHAASPGTTGIWEPTSSEYLVAMNRFTGEVQWARRARYGFPTNAVATAEGRTFVVDNFTAELRWQLGIDSPPQVRSLYERRGTPLPQVPEEIRRLKETLQPEILALDTRTGNVRWRFQDRVSGSWLGYCPEHDLLLQAGQDDPEARMLVLRGEDGSELWRRKRRHFGPPALHAASGRIILDDGALDVLTGEAAARRHPVSDATEPWQLARYHGCGTRNLGQHIITFRSGAAAYYDLISGSGTGNLSGFRAACANNLIPADGLLNAPDMTRGCSCPYQHQTSLALAHVPDVEMWTFNTLADPEPGSIKRVGINLGAPGNRIAEDGLLWVNHPRMPRVNAPVLPVEVDSSEHAKWFRLHALELKKDAPAGYRWVSASGIQGVRRLVLGGLFSAGPNPGGGPTYSVRLHFAEPDRVGRGERVFQVRLQGETVLEHFDIVRQAGGPKRAVVVEFRGVQPGKEDDITVEFRRVEGSQQEPLICGLDVRLEEER